jgi:hypothetical protein
VLIFINSQSMNLNQIWKFRRLVDLIEANLSDGSRDIGENFVFDDLRAIQMTHRQSTNETKVSLISSLLMV